jgi:hypothetical protein
MTKLKAEKIYIKIFQGALDNQGLTGKISRNKNNFMGGIQHEFELQCKKMVSKLSKREISALVRDTGTKGYPVNDIGRNTLYRVYSLLFKVERVKHKQTRFSYEKLTYKAYDNHQYYVDLLKNISSEDKRHLLRWLVYVLANHMTYSFLSNVRYREYIIKKGEGAYLYSFLYKNRLCDGSEFYSFSKKEQTLLFNRLSKNNRRRVNTSILKCIADFSLLVKCKDLDFIDKRSLRKQCGNVVLQDPLVIIRKDTPKEWLELDFLVDASWGNEWFSKRTNQVLISNYINSIKKKDMPEYVQHMVDLYKGKTLTDYYMSSFINNAFAVLLKVIDQKTMLYCMVYLKETNSRQVDSALKSIFGQATFNY